MSNEVLMGLIAYIICNLVCSLIGYSKMTEEDWARTKDWSLEDVIMCVFFMTPAVLYAFFRQNLTKR